ncbi:hypothetical protein [Pseudomarimonas arenosa]|uniref:Uncharacterized protein n=1 Tax=Pseudomarimonas arenosa TaxID=2774145 RepID=A0AAW3ZQ69_9GAMM|nr:hypothetical protein [Pseudomarimonas arenosa]MBD8527080.1 hypothetical protein [Pseudomarimonas arenosa]
MSSIPLSVQRAFVIGPIGDRDAPSEDPRRIVYEQAIEVLEQVIVPACEAFGIEAFRADQIHTTGEIPDQVFRHLRDAPFVIADLSGANPNVMYELGLRHTTGKVTIQIGERGRLPFDIASIRTIMFNRSPGGMVEARKLLAKSLADCLESGGEHVAATRIWFESFEDLSPKSLDSSGEESDEPGFLELIADSEESLQSLAQAFQETTDITGEITQVLSQGTVHLQGVDKSGGSASARLASVNRVASLLNDPTSRFEVTAGALSQCVDRLEPGLRFLAARLSEDRDAIRSNPGFIQSVRSMASGANTAALNARRFIEIIDKVGSASRDMRRVTSRLSKTLVKVADASERLVALEPLFEE